MLPATPSAIVTPASLPECTSRAFRRSSRLIDEPSTSPADDSPTVAAACETVNCASALAFSKATTAVITLVIEAIAVLLELERDHKTLPSASHRMP